MATKDIELEIRAEIDNPDELLEQLKNTYDFKSRTDRLSVMCFGETEAGRFDIRVRVTNGEPEVVIKKGDFHADDRIEVPQPIEPDQFLGFVRQFALFDFEMEVAERHTHNFAVSDEIILALVQSGDIAYIEIEKMSNDENVETDRVELYDIANDFDLDIIEDKSVYEDLVGRLSKYCDWQFSGSDEDFERLGEQLEDYL